MKTSFKGAQAFICVVLAMACFAFSTSVQAQPCAFHHGDRNSPIHVIFANGIQNSPDEACASMEGLQSFVIEATSRSAQIYTSFLYNPSSKLYDPESNGFWYGMVTLGNTVSSLWGDTAELNTQADLSDAAIKSAKADVANSLGVFGDRYYYRLGQAYSAAFVANKHTTKQTAGIYHPPFLLAQTVLNKLNAGKKVILVAHSQGNFVVEAAFAYLYYLGYSVKLQDVKIIGVAPVSYSSPPGNSRYVRIANDLAVFGFAALRATGTGEFAPLGFNVTVSQSASYLESLDPKVHGFNEIYLSSNVIDAASGKSLQRIITDYVQNAALELIPGLPSAAFTANPASATVNQNVAFDASTSTAPNGSITTYVWSFGDGTSNTTTTNSSVNYSYPRAGRYAVRLTITDNLGVSSSVLNIVVVSDAPPPNQAPVASFTASATSATVNQAITFNPAASSDSDGSIVAYAWDFGDGQTNSSSTSVNHSYTTAGSYVVKLTVTDNLGLTGSATKTVVVSAQTPISSTGRLNDTGITSSQCYQAGNDALVACSSAGAIALNNAQDGMTGRDADPATNSGTDGKLGFSFSAVTGGCIQDNVTGLMWEIKTADGGLRDWNKIYTNYGDSRVGDSSAYPIAVNATNLCGHNDWRLPTVDELQSIVDYGVAAFEITIDTHWFPNTLVGVFWSASPYVGDTSYAWMVSSGCSSSCIMSVFHSSRGDTNHVRLVRGGRQVQNRYIVSADGQEVTDSQTSLIWQRCAEGMVISGGTCTGNPIGFTHEAALQRAGAQASSTGKAWRLPNVKELFSIADKSRSNPAIDPAAFPAGPPSLFWSASPVSSYSSYYAYFVYFNYGVTVGYARQYASLVRLVRDGQ